VRTWTIGMIAAVIVITHTVGAAAVLKAGVAQIDITPPSGVPMWGYELRQASGTLDPLYARVLVLEVGESRLAIITLDLATWREALAHGLPKKFENQSDNRLEFPM
jgi:hypothetical protein